MRHSCLELIPDQGGNQCSSPELEHIDAGVGANQVVCKLRERLALDDKKPAQARERFVAARVTRSIGSGDPAIGCTSRTMLEIRRCRATFSSRPAS